MRIQISTKNRAATVAATCVVIALTACGGQPGNSGQAGNAGQAGAGGAGTGSVASLPASPGQPSSGASTTAGQGGPAGLTGVTMPDNATPAERNRIEDAWASCMEAHGEHHFVAKPGGPGGFLTWTVPLTQLLPAAVQACRSLQPHPPWQEMPQYNPNYQRDFAQWVTCLNAKGVPVKAVPGGWTYNGTSSLSAAQQDKVTLECEMQAFNEN
jgi:hypothetical protein